MPSSDVISINGVDYIKKGLEPKVGPEVLVRTYSAGVHMGVLKSRDGKEVVLSGSRRLWQWAGAFTLNAVATDGVDRNGSRISKPVSEITLLDVIEIIPISSGVDLSTTEK